MKQMILLVESAEQLDEGVKSQMAAIGLAGLIVGANLPDTSNDKANVDKPSPYTTQAPQYDRTADKFEIVSWNEWQTGKNYGYQINLNILKPVRLVCRLYDAYGNVIGQSGRTRFTPGPDRQLVRNESGRDAVRATCQEV